MELTGEAREEFAAEFGVVAKDAPQDRGCHRGFGLFDAAPGHAGVYGVDVNGKAQGVRKLFDAVRKLHRRLFLDLRAREHPVGDAAVFRNADHAFARHDPDPAAPEDRSEVVRAGGPHLQGADDDQAVVAALVREVRCLRAGNVAPRKDLAQKELRHAASGFFGVGVVLDVDHERAQHLVDAFAHLDFEVLQVARFEVVGNVVVRMK